MVDLVVSAQLQQWAFEKPTAVRPERSASSASSTDLSHKEPDTLRIDAAAANASLNMGPASTTSFQDRYMSSEEDLSPLDANTSDSDYASDVQIHQVRKECLKARRLSISRWDKGLSCDMAVLVSYVSAGRPKMIELAGSPTQETTQRPPSFEQLPITAIDKLRTQEMLSRPRSLMSSSTTTSRSASPAITLQSRRSSMGRSPYSQSIKSNLQASDSTSSLHVPSSIRSSSPSVSERSTPSTRPVSAVPYLHAAPRSSLYLTSTTSKTSITGPSPPLSTISPDAHSFLSSDPYENSTTNAASPIIRSPPHKRLRSISQKLSLAKIAITPSTKKWDSRINARAATILSTPATPYTPMAPQTAPITTSSSPLKKLHRNSKMVLSRPPTASGPAPELPPMPTLSGAFPRSSGSMKMVARGANERAPTLELPPFPVDDGRSMSNGIKTRRVRKRKSLMDLL